MSGRRRIVAGFDGSAGSWAAVVFAAAEAAASGGVLRLVHAQLHREVYAAMAPPGVVGEAPAEAERLLAAARVALHQECPELPLQTVVAQRPAGPALVRAAQSADLIVVGRRGHAAVPGPAARHAPAGSVVRHVIAHASCPVVVAPGAALAGRLVVLGLDPFAPPSPAVRHAFEAARHRGAGLRICYVRRPDGEPWPDDAHARRLLGEVLAGWRAEFADVPVALDVLAGFDPAARLLDVAAGAALIVVGTRELGGMGTVPDVLVRNAPCPVAVVRARHDRAPQPADAR